MDVFSLFRNYLPLEKGGALHLNKLESPSPKNALCQVWLKLTQWFWRRRTKGWNQQTDLKTKYPYYSCLHEVTFIKSPFECSNSNLVHQQKTIKQLFKLHSSKFTILLFQQFFKGKKLKIRSYQEFSYEIREKIRNCSKSGIIRNNQENQEVLDRLTVFSVERCGPWASCLYWHKSINFHIAQSVTAIAINLWFKN